jgi:TatD DNase family protein
MEDMALVDSHAHMADAAFDPDRAEVLARARAAGVGAIVCVGETLAEAERILALAAEHPLLRPCAGLFPTYLDEAEAGEVVRFLDRNRDRLVAVGEVGLDHWKVQEPAGLEIQERIFRRFVQAALRLDLPVNVHSRSAGRRTIEVLREEGARRVLLHAFDGRAATAAPAVEAGYFFSVPPSTVRSAQKQKLFRRLPLENLLLETDSPVLGPDPGVRNEPANLLVAARALAALKGVEESAVLEATTANARRLFGDALSRFGLLRPFRS